MFEFLKIQYRLGKIGEQELQRAVVTGWITVDEARQIMDENAQKPM